jgi:small conductance mechanosensitive channel
VFVVSGLRAMGFPITSLLTAMGISGIIIGMGLRAQISNYFAGVMMLAARPFRQGDLIEFGPPPQIGVVREVCMTYTALDSLDNVRIVCPNAVLWRNRIYNFSVHPQRAIRIALKLPFDTDIAWVREIATDVLQRHAAVADEPAPMFRTAEVAQDHVKALLIAWSNVDSMTVFGDVIREMRKQFESAGIEVTVPADPVDLKREE